MAAGSWPPTGTVTFVFTDIEGSTSMWEQYPVEMRTAVERHDEIVRSAIERHGGYVFSRGGDAFSAAFARAGDAVEAARLAQSGLAAEAWPVPVPIRVRMGIHTGEAQERDGDYFGPALNRAARIMAAGHGGQVLVSSVTAELVGADALADVGEHRLKDLSAVQRLFQVGRDSFPALRSLDVVRHNLPVQRTDLLGRAGDVAMVRDFVRRDRIVTLIGSGGAGKTRLALAAAAEMIDEFPDGVFFVDLAPLVDGALVPETVVRAVGLSLEGLAGSGLDAVQFAAQLLARRELLVVLDNCERVIDAAGELVDTLLVSGAGPRVLATSRELLGIEGERVYRVPSLPVGSTGGGAGAAVELFVQRAGAAGVGLEIADAAIARICERLGGLPLAIELAAAQMTVMRPAELEVRLDHPFDLLVAGRGRRNRRHHTLAAVLDASWELLDDAGRDLLAQLSVFSGGWTLVAAESTCRVTGSVPALMRSLVDRSLVELYGTGEVARFRMLETVRLYAAQRLAESGAADSVRDRHLGWLTGWAASTTVDEHLCDVSWRNAYIAELDNIRAAMAWALERGRFGDVAVLLGAGVLVWWEGWAVTEIPGLLERVLGSLPDPSPELLFTASLVAFVIGRHDQMAPWVRRAAESARRSGDRAVQSAAQSLLAFVTANIDAEEGLGLAHEAERNAIAAGARHLQALALGWGAVSLQARDDHEEAIARFERALRLDPAPDSIIATIHNSQLGYSLVATGRVDAARRTISTTEDRLDRYGAHELSFMRQSVIQLHALVAAAEGDLAALQRQLDRALRVTRDRSGNSYCVADVCVVVAHLLDESNRSAAAEMAMALQHQRFTSPVGYLLYRRLRERLGPNLPQQPRVEPDELHAIANRLLDRIRAPA